MVFCPYCSTFKPTTRCEIAACGGFVCANCNKCNRTERFHPKKEPGDVLSSGLGVRAAGDAG